MTNIIEEKFVKSFINKQMQDRLLFELSSPKNRERAICRFGHNANELLNPKNIVLKDSKIFYCDVERIISKKFDINKDCYIVSLSDADGTFQPFSKAIDICFTSYMPTIIICGEDAVLIKEEVAVGETMKYILIRNSDGAKSA
jgi:hypothetical protein